MMRELGMSLGVVYSFADRQFHTFYEREAAVLVAELQGRRAGGRVQHRRFRLRGAQGLRRRSLRVGPHPRHHGLPPGASRIPAKARLGGAGNARVSKSADGLQALAWYREGRLDLIEKYCIDDVRLTRDLYLAGKRNRHVLVSRYSGAPHRVEVDW